LSLFPPFSPSRLHRRKKIFTCLSFTPHPGVRLSSWPLAEKTIAPPFFLFPLLVGRKTAAHRGAPFSFLFSLLLFSAGQDREKPLWVPLSLSLGSIGIPRVETMPRDETVSLLSSPLNRRFWQRQHSRELFPLFFPPLLSCNERDLSVLFSFPPFPVEIEKTAMGSHHPPPPPHFLYGKMRGEIRALFFSIPRKEKGMRPLRAKPPLQVLHGIFRRIRDFPLLLRPQTGDSLPLSGRKANASPPPFPSLSGDRPTRYELRSIETPPFYLKLSPSKVTDHMSPSPPFHDHPNDHRRVFRGCFLKKRKETRRSAPFFSSFPYQRLKYRGR